MGDPIFDVVGSDSRGENDPAGAGADAAVGEEGASCADGAGIGAEPFVQAAVTASQTTSTRAAVIFLSPRT